MPKSDIPKELQIQNIVNDLPTSNKVKTCAHKYDELQKVQIIQGIYKLLLMGYSRLQIQHIICERCNISPQLFKRENSYFQRGMKLYREELNSRVDSARGYLLKKFEEELKDCEDTIELSDDPDEILEYKKLKRQLLKDIQALMIPIDHITIDNSKNLTVNNNVSNEEVDKYKELIYGIKELN